MHEVNEYAFVRKLQTAVMQVRNKLFPFLCLWQVFLFEPPPDSSVHVDTIFCLSELIFTVLNFFSFIDFVLKKISTPALNSLD